MVDLYRVRVGQDDYLGTAEEVVRFMAAAEGAPGHDAATYMQGIARRLRARMGVERVCTESEAAFLDSLAEAGVLVVDRRAAPSEERHDPARLLGGEERVAYGPGVDPADLPC
jgi:predicted RNA-binding Zn ribbon-like protein